jgi:hypothetical protein
VRRGEQLSSMLSKQLFNILSGVLRNITYCYTTDTSVYEYELKSTNGKKRIETDRNQDLTL